jgi:hypothetical protein
MEARKGRGGKAKEFSSEDNARLTIESHLYNSIINGVHRSPQSYKG